MNIFLIKIGEENFYFEFGFHSKMVLKKPFLS